jgi:hypothetical protein
MNTVMGLSWFHELLGIFHLADEVSGYQEVLGSAE